MNPFFFLSGEYAKNCFKNVKKRYLKRMDSVKQLDKLGTSSATINKTKRKLDAFFSLTAILSQGKQKAT